VDGQAAVDEVGRQQTSEIVWGEPGLGEFRAMFGQFRAELAKDLHHGGGAEHLAAGADDALEQERLGELVFLSCGSNRVTSGMVGRSWVCRRMITAMTWKSSADIGMTRSRSVFDGAITSRATTSPLGR
jgi:hypothetical protein